MKIKSIVSKSEQFSRNIICAFMFVIMGFLFVETFMHTMTLSCTEKMFEGITYHHDNFFLNTICTSAVILVVSVLLSKIEKIPTGVLTAIISVFTLTLGVIWVNSAQVSPTADQFLVTNAAKLAAQGDMTFMEDKYFSNSPYQLGMVLFYEVLMRIFGKNRDTYIYIQIINVIHLVLAYIGLTIIIHKTFDSKRITNLALLTMPFAVQPIMYTTFIYGVLPGITYGIYALLFEILYFRSNKKRGLIWAAASAVFMSLSVMVKTNNYIVLIALCILASIKFMNRLKITDIVYIAVMLVMSLNILSLTGSMYEKRSGIKLGESVPMIAYMAMGLDEPGGVLGCDAAGWYSSHHTTGAHTRNEFDAEKTSADAKAAIKERIDKFIGDYKYSNDFFYEKNTSQWNEPTYASLWINIVMHNYHGKEYGRIADFFCGEGKGYADISEYMNFFQLFVYMSSFAGIIVCFRKKDIFCSGLILIVLGGFLYHMLFEGKSQYIMPYFIILIGFSAVGTDYLSSKASLILAHINSRSEAVQNNTPQTAPAAKSKNSEKRKNKK